MAPEVLLYESEINYLQQILPKGYCLVNSSTYIRNKPSKPQNPVPIIPEVPKVDLKDDSLIKRAQRAAKEKTPVATVTYVPPKPVKGVSEVLKKCKTVLGQVQKHKFAEPFLKPVDWQALGLPDYPTIVKEPMDLGTVEKKLKSGAYATSSQFAADVRKIWSNAILYNPKTSPIYNMTTTLADYFEQLFQEVEDAPFMDQTVDQIQKKAVKVEKKLDELKTKGSATEGEYVEKPMTFEEKKQLFLMIKGRLWLTRSPVHAPYRHQRDYLRGVSVSAL